MTPGGQGPHGGVGQCPRAPEAERRVLPIAFGPVEIEGEAVQSGPRNESGWEEEEEMFTAAAML